MKTLYIQEYCPSSRKNKKLKQIIKAAKKTNCERLRFLDTFIFLKPCKPANEKRIRRTIFPLPKVQRTFYAILVTTDDSYGYVDRPKVLLAEPCWKSLSYIKAVFEQINKYYIEQGYEVTLLNSRQNKLIRLEHE
jgi:hypothetical protein